MRSLDAETAAAKIGLTTSENFVLTFLSWKLWKGVCNPSVATIARRTSMKEKTVRGALAGLQKKGRITALSRNRLGVTNWRINLPESVDIAAQESTAIAAQKTPPPLGRGKGIQPLPNGSGTPPPLGRAPLPNGGGNRSYVYINPIEVEKLEPGKTPEKPPQGYRDWLVSREALSGAATPPLDDAAKGGDRTGTEDSLALAEPRDRPAPAVAEPEKRSSGMNSAEPQRIAQV